MITKYFTEDFNLSSDELAYEFCEMDAEQQAKVFNEIGRIAREGWNRDFCFQMQYIIDSHALDEDGKYIIKLIGDYGKQMP